MYIKIIPVSPAPCSRPALPPLSLAVAGAVLRSLPPLLYSGSVYHLVLSAPGGSPSAWAQFAITTPHNGIYPVSGALDLNANVLESFDGGGTWDLMNANPVYVLDYSGGVEEGVSEAKQVVASNNSVFGVPAQQWIAETFTLGSSTQLSGFRVRLNAPAGGPSAPVSFTLASYSAGVLGSTIGSGNLGVINDTAFRWYTGLFGSNPTLIPGTYALAFSTTSGDSTSGYYQFSIADSSSQFSPYSGLTYDGSNSAYAISTNAGASFSANTGRDLAFELLLAPQQANLGQSWGMDTSNPGFLSRLGAAGAVFNGQMWVIGGTNDPGPNYLNDAWVSSDGFNWSQQGTLGTSGRTGAAAAVLGSPATLWVSGGSNSLNVPLSDVWANTGSGWTQQSTGAAFGGRFGHGMVSFGNKLWVIGGFNSGFLQDVWNSGDGVNWTPVTAAGPSPPGTISAVWFTTTGFGSSGDRPVQAPSMTSGPPPTD